MVVSRCHQPILAFSIKSHPPYFIPRCRLESSRRSFSKFSPLLFFSTPRLQEIRDASGLPGYTLPRYDETKQNSLLSLRWPAPPQNILLVKKENSPDITQSLVLAATYIHKNYPGVSIILEPSVAEEVHEKLTFPIYVPKHSASPSDHNTVQDSDNLLRQEINSGYHRTVDLICTLGGDGTILHASSLFATSSRVPPMIPFSMGTLGFLGGWNFDERKRAFREVYMSGSGSRSTPAFEQGPSGSQGAEDLPPRAPVIVSAGDDTSSLSLSPPRDWDAVHAYSCGSRTARVLIRHRLQVSLHEDGKEDESMEPSVFAMNEVLLHRGSNPHLAVLTISIGGHFLTDAIADGVIISTPTGSTAYSLSSGGAIVHPAVSALLITPVCPRSLSFRPLVLPANAPVEIRLGPAARSSNIELSVDGQVKRGLKKGMVVRVQGEEVRDGIGGVPTIVRGAMGAEYGVEGDRDAHWVGGLNGLLKFNYPFGEEKN